MSKKRKAPRRIPIPFNERNLQKLCNDPKNYHTNIADFGPNRQRGLCLRPRKDGAAWVARNQKGGKVREKVLGAYPRMSVDEARAAAAAWLVRPVSGEITFGFAVEHWLREQKKVYPQTARALNEHLKAIHPRRLDDLEIVAVATIIKEIAKTHKPEAMLVLAKAKRVTKYAAASGWTARDILGPVEAKDLVKYAQEERGAIEDDDVLRSIFADDTWSGRALRACLLTGARIGEVLEYDPATVDQDHVWHRPASIMKGRRAHKLPLSDMAFELFDQCLPIDISYSSIYQYSVRHYGFSPHDMRRTAGTRLMHLGVSEPLVEHILAHTKDKIVRIYQRGQPIAQMGVALEQLATHYRTIIAAK